MLHREFERARNFFASCCAILISMIVTNCAAQPDCPQPLRLRVLSYNIHHGEGVDRKLDLPRIAGVIRSVDPDLVALQEVDQNVARSQSIDQPAELARLTGLQVVFGGNISLQGGEYGNAVLSRFPLVHENHLLPRVDESEQRGVIVARVDLPAGHPPLRFFATHFDHRRAEGERLASADRIAELMEAHTGQAALLAGDLNDTPESATLKRLTVIWTIANPRPLATIPVDRPTRQIDFVLYYPRHRWKVSNVIVLPEAVASDHRALLAELELLPPDHL